MSDRGRKRIDGGGRVAILMVLSEINNIVSPGICQGLRTGEEIKPESRFQEAAQTDHILSRGKLGVVALIASSFQYLLLDTIHSNGLGGGGTQPIIKNIVLQ